MIDQNLLNILVCPQDRGPLLLVSPEDGSELLYNPRLRRAYRIEDGIPVLLIDEARGVGDAEHARLMERSRPPDPR
ncbi:Trm112 family protein [Mycobacterium tilburgii]|uniref:Trm112 family protein n=1 Tax=Mycobacterium tilburgii TaxID=44467 RepID=UPI001183BA9C|nr:Trm112 family protein [Mycobacterium tilburgii]